MNITDICIRKPVLAWMMMASTLLFGVVSGSQIGISQFPDVDLPNVTVQVTMEGAAPEVIENDVVDVLEEALIQVEGVKTLSSSCRRGSASLSVELNLDRNVDLAMQDVQAKVAQVARRLPREVDPPTISKSNPEDQPILWISLGGHFPRQALSDYAKYRLKEKLQTVPGVGEITMGGSLDRNIRLWIDGGRLDEKGLTVSDVTESLRREHIELPAGVMETSGREISVRILGEAIDLEALRNIAVGRYAGRTIHMHEVALVEDGFEDVRRLARSGGEPVQMLGIRKQRGSNAVAVARGVREALALVEKSLPEGMSVGIANDATRFIEESVRQLEHELVLSVLLTALVCWMFLGSISSTMNVILAIPMSLMGTVAAIYFLGFTLNTFTLLGLALAVGLVVDDAIMVMENIVRHGEMGKSPGAAAREGTYEIAAAAFAATLAVVAIFIPVVFMQGVIGRFFMQFGVTLSIAVMISYLEAVTLAPARCAQLLGGPRMTRSGLGGLVDAVFAVLEKVYAFFLGWSVRHPYFVLMVTSLLMYQSYLVMLALPREFVPSQDQGRIIVRLQTPVGTSFSENDRALLKAEAIAARHKEITRVLAILGSGGGGGTATNNSMMMLNLAPLPGRKVGQSEISSRLRNELNTIPGLKAVIQDVSQQGFTAQRGYPVEFSVRGRDWNELVKQSRILMNKLRESGLVLDLDSDYDVGVPELVITPDKQRCTDMGVAIETVALTLNALVGGARVGKYSSGGRRFDIRVRAMASQRSRPEDLSRLRVRTRSGALVPLSALVTYDERPALNAITRKDRDRAITVVANVAAGKSQDAAIQKVEELGRDLPEGYRIVLAGSSVAFRESTNLLLFALVMGILVAYMVLASQFNSFVHPITILSILPLSVSGAAIALWLTGLTLNVFSMIGLLLLMGIVKKNSIILVEYASHIQADQNLGAAEAMQQAGPIRLRPILMTSLATMMAAVPSALIAGPGSETRAPMAVAILGGLVVSTLLSLLVVPAFYVVADRFVSKAPPTGVSI